MFSAASVCLFVCVNTITSERVNIWWWNLGVGALYKNLSRVRIWGHSPPGWAHPKCGVALRRWENQRRLSRFWYIYLLPLLSRRLLPKITKMHLNCQSHVQKNCWCHFWDSWICRTGICWTGKWRTKSQGWNLQDWKMTDWKMTYWKWRTGKWRSRTRANIYTAYDKVNAN